MKFEVKLTLDMTRNIEIDTDGMEEYEIQDAIVEYALRNIDEYIKVESKEEK